MIDKFLENYKGDDTSSAYNAPQRFRSHNAKYGNNLPNPYLTIWNSGKKNVLAKLMDKINELTLVGGKIGFAVAPSNTPPFYEDIDDAIVKRFPSFINLTSCFSKNNGFCSGISRRILSDPELRNQYFLNTICFSAIEGEILDLIILVDDIYDWGNTFKAMEILINDLNKNVIIKTAVILKIQ